MVFTPGLVLTRTTDCNSGIIIRCGLSINKTLAVCSDKITFCAIGSIDLDIVCNGEKMGHITKRKHAIVTHKTGDGYVIAMVYEFIDCRIKMRYKRTFINEKVSRIFRPAINVRVSSGPVKDCKNIIT